MKLLPNDREKMEFPTSYPNFCRRLANDSENYFMVVCWLWHFAATAVALKRHERVNAFNLAVIEINRHQLTYL